MCFFGAFRPTTHCSGTPTCSFTDPLFRSKPMPRNKSIICIYNIPIIKYLSVLCVISNWYVCRSTPVNPNRGAPDSEVRRAAAAIRQHSNTIVCVSHCMAFRGDKTYLGIVAGFGSMSLYACAQISHTIVHFVRPNLPIDRIRSHKTRSIALRNGSVGKGFGPQSFFRFLFLGTIDME
jgi:hypothetical protein